jgi:hypothetical protein
MATVAYFVLAIYTPFDVARLNEGDYLSFNFFDTPPKDSAHPLELDGYERLEIQDDTCVTYEIC